VLQVVNKESTRQKACMLGFGDDLERARGTAMARASTNMGADVVSEFEGKQTALPGKQPGEGDLNSKFINKVCKSILLCMAQWY
jgi:hypothetical protein